MAAKEFDPKLIVTDAELDDAFSGTNFGNVDRRTEISEALFSFACGFISGSTITRICRDLGLLGIGRDMRLTKKGKRFLYGSTKGISS